MLGTSYLFWPLALRAPAAEPWRVVSNPDLTMSQYRHHCIHFPNMTGFLLFKIWRETLFYYLDFYPYSLLAFCILWCVESIKEQCLFEIYIFCSIINVIAVSFDQFKAFLMNKSINLKCPYYGQWKVHILVLGVPNNMLTCMQGQKTLSLSSAFIFTLFAQQYPNDSLNDSSFQTPPLRDAKLRWLVQLVFVSSCL